LLKNGCDVFYQNCKKEVKNMNLIEEKNFKIFGVPFDGTVSYRPGARFGPSAVRENFYGIEDYSPVLDVVMGEKLYEMCQNFPVLDIPIGNTEAVLDMIEGYVDSVCSIPNTTEGNTGIISAQNIPNTIKGNTDNISAQNIPIMLGGEHLVTLGAVRSLVKKFPNLHIIHFDAHADLREDYLGVKLSHACVMRRCIELGCGLTQFGIRSGTKEEFEFGREFACREIPKGVPCYLSIDLDVIDPSLFCGTGTPEPGGWLWGEFAEKLYRVASENDIVGADIVELAPSYDASGVSTVVACKVLRELLLSVDRKN
jgi:agmatinase